MKKYEDLRAEYPETISLDQLYRICRISKKSAAYLIRHGIIPAEDTGRKTWRYRIALEDVIDYLYRRDKVGSMIPRGAANSRSGKSSLRTSYTDLIKGCPPRRLTEYFSFIYSDYPDVLTVDEITEMTGLCHKTIFLLLKDGALTAIEKQPKYFISKKTLLEFVSTPRFVESKSNSEVFRKIIGGFEKWKAAKS
jgi:hypothetical protein